VQRLASADAASLRAPAHLGGSRRMSDLCGFPSPYFSARAEAHALLRPRRAPARKRALVSPTLYDELNQR